MIEAIVAVVAAAVGAVVGMQIGARRAGADARAIEEKVETDTRNRLEAEARASRLDIEEAARKQADATRERAEKEAREIRQKAEEDADRLRDKIRKDGEEDLRARRAELDKTEDRLTKREEKLDERAVHLDRKQSELAEEEKNLQRLDQSVSDRQRNLKEREAELATQLEAIAGLSKDEARSQLVAAIEEDARLDAARIARQIEEQAVEEADRRAKKVLAVTIQRYAGEFVAERCVSVVQLPSDDLKGRIIGREGRNIRAIEAATGVDFIVDDTPEAIIISAFDPVRREIARLSLEKLIADGRIHPSRIEEIVDKTRTEMDGILKEAGETAAFELGLTGLHPEIIKMMGRLKYRTSYGQNMWSHSIEVGYLCGMMASELGLNTKLARRAGFLHDIGKAMDHELEGGHAIIGANFIKKHGEDELIVNAVGAHHDEMKPNSVIAHLVIAADALSGARPGARREILESYVRRLEDLERISSSFDGVERSFAVQAGREVRVIVEHGKVNDDQAALLSREIARKIENDLTYPGQIKITVIREVRASEYAR
ncbi:MAG: ribonuclease Y [Deltaproteobacteria bacterium]|nr:MAG: ribonuclease Y [Deltaproteobacteria bacterium]